MIKRLMGCIREYKAVSIRTPIFTSIEVILEVFIPLLMAKLIDYGINGQNMREVMKYGLILLICAMFSLLFGTLAGSSAAEAAAGFARNLRHDVYHSVQRFSFYNIDKFSTASIVTRCTTDITNIQNAYQMIIRVAVRCPVMLVFAMVLSFSINSKLSMIFLFAIPLLGVGLFLIIKHVHPLFERIFKTYDKLNTVVQENLRGIRVVKSYVREDHEREKFQTISNNIYQDFSHAEKIVAFNMPLMQFAAYTCIILISWFSAHLIVGGTMTTGELVSMVSYATQILISLMMLSMVLVMIIISRASVERVVEILDEVPDLLNPEKPITNVKDGSVRFTDVSFSYNKDPNKLSLIDINLNIASGETVGILGGTGSSKSSLVQLIPRLYDVTKGKILVGGVDVRQYEIQVLRNEVAMVLQKNVLFSGTIRDNLRWGDENASDAELERVCKLAQADEFIHSFPKGYDTFIEEGGSNVSGGQKQRLCIARALLKKPKILILDDSTSAVDTKTDALIRTAFRDVIPNTTKIIIAQRISSIQDADKIIILNNGRIHDIGTHEELLNRNPIYQEVYYSQQKGDEEHA